MKQLRKEDILEKMENILTKNNKNKQRKYKKDY